MFVGCTSACVSLTSALTLAHEFLNIFKYVYIYISIRETNMKDTLIICSNFSHTELDQSLGSKLAEKLPERPFSEAAKVPIYPVPKPEKLPAPGDWL